MNKKDVAVKIRNYANELLTIADMLDEKEIVEVAKPITLVEVRKFLAELSRDGKTSNVRDLLNKLGASKLSEINPENYAALLDDARKLKDGK